MPVELQRPQHDDIRRWSVADWNNVLFLYFFASPHGELTAPVVTLNVTGENLREAAGRNCTRTAAKAAFIEAIKQGIGARTLEVDAFRRRTRWSLGLDTVPPYLSHLLLTCMVANDLSEELQATSDLRIRLALILGTGTQPLFRRFRFLWEEFAAWSVRQNVAGGGCRPLRLPQIPQTGHHSIIGYSIRLAVPSRRDQTTLATLFRKDGLLGREPEINPVVSLVSANIGRFSNAFSSAFEDFEAAFKSKRFAVLAQTAFWIAVRAIALAGGQGHVIERTGGRVRLELEDDDGRFWFALTSEADLRTDHVRSFALPTPRQSQYRFLLKDAAGKSLVDILFSSKRIDHETERTIATIRSAVAEGLLVFEETDDYVFALAASFPSGGRLRALVSDRLKPSFKRALEQSDLTPDIRNSASAGWSEWRDLTAEGLRSADISRFPSLQAVRSLRVTIPPPEIKLRGGIRHGSSYIAMPGALPSVEIADAEQVSVELVPGNWQALLHDSDAPDRWHFASDLAAAGFIGSHRIVAFASSVPIAEKVLHFVATTLSHDYKLPSHPERWLVETSSIDMASFVAAASSVEPIAVNPAPDRDKRRLVADQSFLQPSDTLTPLTTLLCSRFSAQRGLSEGDLVEMMKGELGIRPASVWPVLRAWLEGGMLDLLTDKRWRARIYFARVPQLVVHRRRGFHEAVLTGLVPPYLRDRFDALAAALQLTNLDRRSVSPFVPSLPRCRSGGLAALAELAKELNAPQIVRLREVGELLTDIRRAATTRPIPAADSWPSFRKWDWSRRSFNEHPSSESISGISLDWCRRDDGPDRYKIYKDGSLLWWTGSRTWAVLAAFTLADMPVFNPGRDASMYSLGDSLYLPLPAARAVAWSGPANSGPVTLEDGSNAYAYAFHDDRSRNSVLARMWPGDFEFAQPISPRTIAALSAAFRTCGGAKVPLPVGLKRTLDLICEGSAFHAPAVVPISALPRLYALVDASRGREL